MPIGKKSESRVVNAAETLMVEGVGLIFDAIRNARGLPQPAISRKPTGLPPNEATANDNGPGYPLYNASITPVPPSHPPATPKKEAAKSATPQPKPT
jgi:hypothetical protein